MTARFLWTRRTIEHWADGKSDPRHTISAPNITECYMGFVSQLKKGTPWALVNAKDEIVATGTAGFGIAEIRLP